MKMGQNILVSVDESEASIQAVQYVAEMIGFRTGSCVYLFHVLPPIPPELLEFGGSEDPKEERKLSYALREEQAQWIDHAKEKAQPFLAKAKDILEKGGVSPNVIKTEFSQSIHRPDVVRHILETAQKLNCGTIVVGRESFPFFREMVQDHIGQELVRKGKGFSIWVVE